MRSEGVLLRDLLLSTKDGEWGRGEPGDGLIPMGVIRGTDFEAVRLGNLDDLPTRHVPERIAARKTLQPRDILIETAGGTKDRPTGRTVFLRDELIGSSSQPLTCASFSRYLRVDPELAEPEYVFWYLQYLYSVGEMEHHQVQHTGVARFQYTAFAASTGIPLPGRERQRSVCSTLRELDEKIALNRRMNHTLESIARAIFKSWFVDFDPVRKKIEGGDIGLPPDLATLFPASFDHSTMGSVPRGWPVIPLSSLVDVNPKYTLARGSRVPYVEMSGLPTDAARVTQWRIREFTSGSRFRNGDVLVARITPCLENGKTALVDCLDGDVTAWGSTEFLVLRPHEPVPTEYVYCLSRSDAFRDYAVGSMNGSSGRQRVPVEAIERLPIVRPPDGLLRAFRQVAHSAVSLMAENDRQSESLAALRDCLLPKFLSGDISL